MDKSSVSQIVYISLQSHAIACQQFNNNMNIRLFSQRIVEDELVGRRGRCPAV